MVVPYERGDPMRLLIAHPSASFAGALREKLIGELEISWVSDGTEALEMLNSLCPEILILHLSLPRKDGLTLLEQLEYLPSIVLVTTDYSDPFVSARLHKLGARGILLMPMVSTVTQWVHRLLENSALLIRSEPTERILHSLGFRSGLTGYDLLCRGLELLQKDPGQTLSGIYKRLGHGAAVEKAIRMAIHTAWQEGERQVWKKYFDTDTCPGNKTFLLTLLQPDLHRLADDHTVFRDSAIHGQNFHTGGSGLPQGNAEGRVGGIVGVQVQNPLHLDDEQHIGAVAFPNQTGQFPQVPGTPLRGCVGEGADTILFQGDALDL